MNDTEWKANRALFRPQAPSQTLRQQIYAELQKAVSMDGTSLSVKVTALARKLNSVYSKTRAAAKQLVKAGLIERSDIEEGRPNKADPSRKVKVLAVRMVPPWGSKKNTVW